MPNRQYDRRNGGGFINVGLDGPVFNSAYDGFEVTLLDCFLKIVRGGRDNAKGEREKSTGRGLERREKQGRERGTRLKRVVERDGLGSRLGFAPC